MGKSAKEVVRGFYRADILKDRSVLKKYFHPDLVLIWNSADGLSIMHFDDLVEFFEEITRTYHDLRIEVSHLLEDGPHVTIRYKYYVRTVENPDEELQKRPIMGLELLSNFEFDGDDEWEDGDIYDPKSGKTYSCYMEFTDKTKNELKVRGYIGVSLLGRTTYWTRVE